MTERTSARLFLKTLPLFALAGAVAAATPAAAVDPVFDPMRPNEGQAATAPRQAEREMRRDLETKTPTLTERFGLPPVSGPLPPLLPPPGQRPVLLDPGPNALPPPPQPRPQRARRPRDRDS
jgi:hypothetical protein